MIRRWDWWEIGEGINEQTGQIVTNLQGIKLPTASLATHLWVNMEIPSYHKLSRDLVKFNVKPNSQMSSNRTAQTVQKTQLNHDYSSKTFTSVQEWCWAHTCYSEARSKVPLFNFAIPWVRDMAGQVGVQIALFGR